VLAAAAGGVRSEPIDGTPLLVRMLSKEEEEEITSNGLSLWAGFPFTTLVQRNDNG
jgi:hypothetical protein